MLETAIVLIVGFGLGYGVREWLSRRRRQAERESGGKRPLDNSLGMTSAGHHHTPLCRAPTHRFEPRRRVGAYPRSTNSSDMELDYRRELIALCLLAGLGFGLALAHE